jgi:hypothetical protein
MKVLLQTPLFRRPVARLFPSLITVAAVLLNGCASHDVSYLRPKLPPNDARVTSLVAFYSQEEKVAAFYQAGIDSARVADSSGNVITQYTYGSMEARRNKIIYDLIFIINDYYDRYELSRYATVAGIGFAGDVATLGLDTAATAVGGAGLKTLLAAISTGVGGTKIAAQRDFLQNQNVGLLVQKMRQLRGEVFQRLQSRLHDPVEAYPLEAALVDLQDYFHAGTLIGAIQALSNETGADKLITEAADAQNTRAKAFIDAAAARASKAKSDKTTRQSEPAKTN